MGERLTDSAFNAEWAAEGFEAPVLRLAADEHGALLVRAEAEVVAKTLAGLRSATMPRQESPEEAEASFNLLRAHLADVPADILKEACRRYVNRPGRRYFPRSAGELREFINPLHVARKMAEYRLRQMADAAAERDRRAAATDQVQWDAALVRTLPRKVAQDCLARGWFGQDLFDEAFPPADGILTASEGHHGQE